MAPRAIFSVTQLLTECTSTSTSDYCPLFLEPDLRSSRSWITVALESYGRSSADLVSPFRGCRDDTFLRGLLAYVRGTQDDPLLDQESYYICIIPLLLLYYQLKVKIKFLLAFKEKRLYYVMNARGRSHEDHLGILPKVTVTHHHAILSTHPLLGHRVENVAMIPN